MNACDLNTLLDLSGDEVAALAALPAQLRRYTFSELLAAADRVACSRAAAVRSMTPVTHAADREELERIAFRLRAWWQAIERELRRRCDEGRAEP
jgi:hypothetical protein